MYATIMSTSTTGVNVLDSYVVFAMADCQLQNTLMLGLRTDDNRDITLP